MAGQNGSAPLHIDEIRALIVECHKWRPALSDVEKFESKIDKHFSRQYEIFRIDDPFTRACGIDRLYLRKDKDHRLSPTFSVNYRIEPGASTDGVFLETRTIRKEDGVRTEVYGWFLKTLSQAIIIFDPSSGAYQLFDALEMKRIFRAVASEFKDEKRQQADDDAVPWASVGRRVPLSAFQKCLIKSGSLERNGR